MPRNIPLNDEEKASIRRIKADNPRMTYREIGGIFGVTGNAVCCVLLNKYQAKPAPDAPKQKCISPNTPLPGSIISPLSMAALRAGNGRICRSPIRRDAA